MEPNSEFQPLPQPQSQPESQPESYPESGPAGSSADTAHLQEIAVEDAGPVAGLDGQPAGPQFVPLEVFHATFCGMFNLVSGMSGLKSLHVENEAATSLAASKAVYETACEVPALHFLVSPGGKWAERGFALFAFSAPMVMGVRAELAERRRPAAKPQPQSVESGAAEGLNAFPVERAG